MTLVIVLNIVLLQQEEISDKKRFVLLFSYFIFQTPVCFWWQAQYYSFGGNFWCYLTANVQFAKQEENKFLSIRKPEAEVNEGEEEIEREKKK